MSTKVKLRNLGQKLKGDREQVKNNFFGLLKIRGKRLSLIPLEFTIKLIRFTNFEISQKNEQEFTANMCILFSISLYNYVFISCKYGDHSVHGKKFEQPKRKLDLQGGGIMPNLCKRKLLLKKVKKQLWEK